MSFLTDEDRDWLTPIVDAFLDACSHKNRAEQEMAEAQKNLLDNMAAYELNEIHRHGWSIALMIPEDGDAWLQVTRLGVVDLHE